MTTTLRVYTGTNAGTQSAPQTGIALLSTDSAGTNPAAAEVAPGTNSFEKWLRVIDDGASGAPANYWIERSGDLPVGVVIKLGMTDTPSTPTASTSAVATTTMTEGRRYFFDAAAAEIDGGFASSYVVLQEQVAADADSGAIEQQVFTIGYST